MKVIKGFLMGIGMVVTGLWILELVDIIICARERKKNRVEKEIKIDKVKKDEQ